MKCPAGHSLPFIGPLGACTPMYCSEQKTEAEAQDVPVSDLASSDQSEAGAMQKALERERARAKVLKTPKGLVGAAAEEFVGTKMTELSVLAAMELEGQLRFGNDAARKDAAKTVLAATGHGPKDAQQAFGALIVIQAKDGSVSNLPPWRRKKLAVDTTAKILKKDDEDPEDGD